MTERLFDKDSYIKEFDAICLECRQTESGYAIILDKTAFFPEGGGQKSDTGTLNGISVFDAQENDGIIYHYTSTPIEKDSTVKGIINWDERFFKMQNHTAEHIISGIVHSLYGYENTGFHLSENAVTMDYNGPLDKDDIDKIEFLANEAVWENRTVTCYYPPSTQDITYRSKLDIKENLRIVNIDGIDTCACCAPHLKTTSEAGLIKIVSFMRYKGGVRMFLKAGSLAYNEVCTFYNVLKKASGLLSLPPENITDGIEKLIKAEKDLRYELNGLKAEVLKNEIKGSTVPYVFVDSPELLKDAVNLLAEKFPTLAGAFSGDEENGFRFMIITSDTDKTKELLKSQFNASCGGRDNMLQGMIKCDISAVKNLFTFK
jgi:alanyl-tRNA synthetase